MDKFDRIYDLHRLLRQHRRPVSLSTIQEKLECSESTARRALQILRDKLRAPLEYDREQNGYYYQGEGEPPQYELPGLWFNVRELYALLISYNLFNELKPDVFNEFLAPIKDRIQSLLQEKPSGNPELANRIRIIQPAARHIDLDLFHKLASALIERRQIRVLYHGRERDSTTERRLSPQRIIYYKSNWYLDAWCHLRDNIRTFSCDRLHFVEQLIDDAKDLDNPALDQYFTNTYGIFAGAKTDTAILRFSSSAARWVADEQWHPDQKGKVLKDGSYELHLPYSDPRELVMDILKYGDDVQVLQPTELQELVIAKMEAALARYKKTVAWS